MYWFAIFSVEFKNVRWLRCSTLWEDLTRCYLVMSQTHLPSKMGKYLFLGIIIIIMWQYKWSQMLNCSGRRRERARHNTCYSVTHSVICNAKDKIRGTNNIYFQTGQYDAMPWIPVLFMVNTWIWIMLVSVWLHYATVGKVWNIWSRVLCVCVCVCGCVWGCGEDDNGENDSAEHNAANPKP